MPLVSGGGGGGGLPSQWVVDAHGGLTITVDDAGTIPLTLKLAAGQTADALHIYDSANGDYLYVDNDGNINIGSAADALDSAFNGGVFSGDQGDFQAEAGTKALGARLVDGTLKWLVNGVDGAQRIRVNAVPADVDLQASELSL